MHVGASVVSCELTDRDKEVCETLAPVLRRMGLLFVGIDMIGDKLTEISGEVPDDVDDVGRILLEMSARVEEKVKERGTKFDIFRAPEAQFCF